LNIDFKPFVLVSRGSRGSRGARGRGAGRGAGDAAGSARGLRRSKRVSGRSATTEEEEEEKEGGKGRGKEVEEEEVEEVLITSQQNLSQQSFRNQPSIPSTTQSSPSRTSTHQSSTSHPSLPTQQSSESIDIEYRDWTPRSRSDTPGAGVSPSMSRRSTPAFEIPTQRSQPEHTPDVTQPEHTPQLPEPEHTPQLPEPETPQLANFQQIEKLFAKQGKQIRAIYEMQKTAHEKLSSVQAQLKKLTSKNTELSKKVFGVSNHNLV